MLRMTNGGQRGPEHAHRVDGPVNPPVNLRQLAIAVIVTAAGALAGPADSQAAPVPIGDDNTVQDAREALRVRDKARLLADRDALIQARHPLAPWVDYWYFQLRLMEMGPTEVDEFLARWPDAYVADRARNDWLIELGRRKDWRTFLRIQPSFRMNDDREVSCLGLLARQQSGLPMEGPGEWREQARQAWWGQKDADYGCDAMAQGLLAAGILEPADVWRKLRLVIENDRPRAVQQSAKLLGEQVAQAVDRLMGQAEALLHPDTGRANLGASGGAKAAGHAPGAVIGPAPARGKAGKSQRKGKASAKDRAHARADANLAAGLGPWPTGLTPPMQSALNLLAFIRWSGQDPVAAAAALDQSGARERWGWDGEATAWALAQLGRGLAWRLQPQAPLYYERAVAEQTLALGATERRANASRLSASWSADTLAWMARSGVRAAVAAPGGANGLPPPPIAAPAAWALVEQAIEAMPPEQQQDPAWLYWKAKAVQHHARKAGNHAQVEAHKKQAVELLQRVASPLTFYGQLASEELQGAPAKPPAAAAAVTEAELGQARAMPGVDRALRMLELGWRGEAVREWNFTLSFTKPGGLSDRELLAVAEEACRREVWDRCINSSERTRNEVSLPQRYPTPYREDVLAAAREVGLDPAYMYGLIRQESRFIVAAKSNVGASGLMQVMPGTAAWTARKLQIDYHPDRITDRVTNLRIGAGYLKLLIDDFQGMQALAAAAYNAGPSRPRRWREGSKLDAAAWVENIPFNETRDYVKKVLANAVVYGHLIDGKPLSLKARLGATVGPRAGSAPPEEGDLP
jgi:soluble lytic murein transglycosylase